MRLLADVEYHIRDVFPEVLILILLEMRLLAFEDSDIKYGKNTVLILILLEMRLLVDLFKSAKS